MVIGRRVWLKIGLPLALVSMAACGEPAQQEAQEDPAVQTAAAEMAAMSSADFARRGTLWPNLMIVDGAESIGLLSTAAPPASAARFRIHLDVDLGNQANLTELAGWLKQPKQNEAAIRTRLGELAKLSSVSAQTEALIAVIPFKNGGNPKGAWPRHDLFVDYGTNPVSYWYRMESEFGIDQAGWKAILDAIKAGQVDDFRVALLAQIKKGNSDQDADQEIVAMINVLSPR